MTIDQWWGNARTLSVNLRNDGSSVVSTSRANAYKAVRDVLFPNDTHHAPTKTKASVLLPQVETWMTEVRGGMYGNRFYPAHVGPYTP